MKQYIAILVGVATLLVVSGKLLKRSHNSATIVVTSQSAAVTIQIDTLEKQLSEVKTSISNLSYIPKTVSEIEWFHGNVLPDRFAGYELHQSDIDELKSLPKEYPYLTLEALITSEEADLKVWDEWRATKNP